MCGIVGRIARQPLPSLGPALQAMAHRGPDAQQEAHLQASGLHVQFGHRRLSILDLSAAANQPFHSADGEQMIAFNGEIYNHQVLRQPLQAAGETFRTRSDTEVLLNGWRAEGLKFLPRLNGMFAFALLDRRCERVVLARDPFGIKPLYLADLEDGGLAFASELRSLACLLGRRLVPDRAATAEFLLNGFLYEPASGFEGVTKLMPGCALEIDLRTLGRSTRRYHDHLHRAAPAATTSELINAELQLEVEADVPVGVFFSGGIDSSVLAAGAPRSVEAFLVDYGNGADGDSLAAREVAQALGLRLQVAERREAEATTESILEEFRAVAQGTEEPISDYTYIATRMLSRHAREAGFKVMLSGMGGDELFAGYPRYQAATRWPTLHRWRAPLTLAASAMRRSSRWSKRADRLTWFAQADSFAQAYTSLVGYFSADEVGRLLGSSRDVQASYARIDALLAPVKGDSVLRQCTHLDRFGFLAHNLTVTDRASMAESIEVRVPLLCTSIEDHARSLPDDALLLGRQGKRPLKDYLLPQIGAALVNRPKVPFNPPLDGRIRQIGADRLLAELRAGPLGRVLDLKPVAGWVTEHFMRQRDHTYRLWQLLYLNYWLGTNLPD